MLGTVRTWQLVPCIVAASSLGSLASPSPLGDDACASLPPASTAGARVVYLKSEHRLCLFEPDGSVHSWPASHGREQGKKRFEGDGRTPEGRYMVSAARHSQRFGLFMPISYPNADDAHSARAAGRPPGGAVGIHGPQRWYRFLGRAQALIDHSDGCIVMDADSMQELARRVTKATPIEILSAPRAGD